MWQRGWLAGAALLVALPACSLSLPCEESCAQTIEDGCAADGMPACDELCAALSAEAETAGCTEEWSELEACLGEEPICMGVSRCGDALRAHDACIDAFCASDPGACTGER